MGQFSVENPSQAGSVLSGNQHYDSRRAGDTGLRDRLRALAAERRRFGYRRLHILLAREGFRLNHKRLFRIYREEKLAVRRRGGRKRASRTRAPIALPQGPNQRWSLDFVSDTLVDGRRSHEGAPVDGGTAREESDGLGLSAIEGQRAKPRVGDADLIAVEAVGQAAGSARAD